MALLIMSFKIDQPLDYSSMAQGLLGTERTSKMGGKHAELGSSNGIQSSFIGYRQL